MTVKLYTDNYLCRSDNEISCSMGNLVAVPTLARLFDRNATLQFTSSGYNSDATVFDINFALGTGSKRVIDKLSLRNHNIKSFNFLYWKNATEGWVYLLQQTNISTTDTDFTFSPVSVDTGLGGICWLSCLTTQTPNQEKKIAEIIVQSTIGELDGATDYEPKICSGNVLSLYTPTFTMSNGGDATKLYDRNPLAQFQTTSGSGQGTLISIDMSFSQSVNVDFVCLQNHNLEKWSLHFLDAWTATTNIATGWTGSTWASWNGAELSIHNPTFTTAGLVSYRRFAPISTTRLIFYSDNTSPAAKPKSIGQLIIGLTKAMPQEFQSYDPKWRERSREIVLGDGSIHKVYVKDSSTRLGKYEAAVKFGYVSKTNRDQLKAVKDLGEPIYFIPESSYVPEDAYLVHWSNAWDEKYMSSYKGSGYEVMINVKEV